MNKKINKNKILVPSIGIAGVVAGAIPFVSGCTFHFGPIEPVDPVIDNKISDGETEETELDPNEFKYRGDHWLGKFKLADPSATWPEDMSSFSFNITLINPGQAFVEFSSLPVPSFDGDEIIKSISFYLTPNSIESFETNHPYTLKIQVKYNDEIWYQNNGDGSGKTKIFTFKKTS